MITEWLSALKKYAVCIRKTILLNSTISLNDKFYDFKGSQSCLVSGCNVIFLVDTSNEMVSKNFDTLKKWMKKLITSLSIQSTQKFVYHF